MAADNSEPSINSRNTTRTILVQELARAGPHFSGVEDFGITPLRH